MPYPTAQQTSAVYTLTGPNGHEAVFNDESSVNYVGALLGEDAVTGLDSPEVRAAVYDRVEADGALFGNFYHGNRPITMQGSILSATIAARNTREDRLYKAVNDCMRPSGILKWTPNGGIEQFVYVRKYQPIRIKGGWAKDFFVSLMAADPFIYSTALHSATGIAPSTNYTAVNEGSAAREPALLRITGPTNGTIWFRNARGGTILGEIRLVGMPNLASGEYVDVFPESRTVLHSSGANYFQYVDYGMTKWWRLDPGNNVVSLRGTNTTGSLRIDWRDTWL